MTVEQASLLAGFYDAEAHYGTPDWGLILDAEGEAPVVEVMAPMLSGFRQRWVVGVES